MSFRCRAEAGAGTGRPPLRQDNQPLTFDSSRLYASFLNTAGEPPRLIFICHCLPARPFFHCSKHLIGSFKILSWQTFCIVPTSQRRQSIQPANSSEAERYNLFHHDKSQSSDPSIPVLHPIYPQPEFACMHSLSQRHSRCTLGCPSFGHAPNLNTFH